MASTANPTSTVLRLARLAVPIVLLIAALAGGAATQPIDSFIVQEPTNLGRANRLFRVDGYGAWTSIAATMPTGWAALHATMDERNAGLVVCGVNLSSGALFRVAPGATPTTLVPPGRFNRPIAAVLDETGAWLVGDVNVGGASIDFYRVMRGGQIARLGTLPNYALVRMVYDPEAGQALVLGISSLQYTFLRVDAQQFAVTTFTRTSYPFQPATITNPIYRPETGGFVFAGQTTTASRFPRLYEVTPESGATTLSTIALPSRALGMARYRDRMAPDVYGALVDDGTPSGSIVTLDRQGVVTSTYVTAGGILPGRGFMLRTVNRALARQAPIPGRSLLHASFPFERGKSVAFGVSFGGSRPGTPLPDGRVIPLNVDAFTLLGLTNGLPTVLGGMLQTLDASGRATAIVDVSPFLAQLSGLRMTVVAVALDPTASAGVAEISAPVNIRL